MTLQFLPPPLQPQHCHANVQQARFVMKQARSWQLTHHSASTPQCKHKRWKSTPPRQQPSRGTIASAVAPSVSQAPLRNASKAPAVLRPPSLLCAVAHLGPPAPWCRCSAAFRPVSVLQVCGGVRWAGISAAGGGARIDAAHGAQCVGNGAHSSGGALNHD